MGSGRVSGFRSGRVIGFGSGRVSGFMCAYQPQQVQEQVCVLPDQVVSLTAQVYKVMEAAGWFVSSVNDVRHVGCEHKGGAVST